jgi:Polyketide cyclase / dehydrase and lipid transport
VEEVLAVEPGRRLAYTVLRGIPVRNYRAEVTLTRSPEGTVIRWGASWDRTIMGRLVYRPLRNLYPVIVAGLVQAAEASQS